MNVKIVNKGLRNCLEIMSARKVLHTKRRFSIAFVLIQFLTKQIVRLILTSIGLKLLALFTVHMLPLEFVKEFTMELVIFSKLGMQHVKIFIFLVISTFSDNFYGFFLTVRGIAIHVKETQMQLLKVTVVKLE